MPLVLVLNGPKMGPSYSIPRTIIILVDGLLQIIKDENGSGKKFHFRHNGTDLVLESTFVLTPHWAKLATKCGPIFILTEGMKRLCKG